MSDGTAPLTERAKDLGLGAAELATAIEAIMVVGVTTKDQDGKLFPTHLDAVEIETAIVNLVERAWRRNEMRKLGRMNTDEMFSAAIEGSV